MTSPSSISSSAGVWSCVTLDPSKRNLAFHLALAAKPETYWDRMDPRGASFKKKEKRTIIVEHHFLYRNSRCTKRKKNIQKDMDLLYGILLHRRFLFALQAHSNDITFVTLFLFILCYYTIWKRQKGVAWRLQDVPFIECFHLKHSKGSITKQWNKCTVMHANEFSSKFPLFSITNNVSYAETQLTDGRVNRKIDIFL